VAPRFGGCHAHDPEERTHASAQPVVVAGDARLRVELPRHPVVLPVADSERLVER